MGVEFKNEISWPDVIAILGAIGVCFIVFFDVKEDVNSNSKSIEHVEEKVQDFYVDLSDEINKLDIEARTDRKEILEAINNNRIEAAEGRDKIETQLDRLIERMSQK